MGSTPDELATKVQKVSWRESQALSVDRIGWMIRSATERGVAHYKVLMFDIFFIAEPNVIRELIVKRPHLLHLSLIHI